MNLDIVLVGNVGNSKKICIFAFGYKNNKMTYIDTKIDKLTHSLEDTTTGDILLTEVLSVEKNDLKFISKKYGWKFNWELELAATEKQVFKLVLQNEPKTVQGLICFEKKNDHIFMHLIETASHNLGKTKKYFGIAGNLVAFGCKLSFEYGFEGYIAFESKTKLIGHYEKTLGAKVLYGQKMELDTNASIKLIKDYYPEFFNK
jgi:hypothetical protein